MTSRGITFTETTTLVTETCCNCGVLFALTEDYQKRAMRTHDWWYCPNGHSQHYTGKSDKDRLAEANRQIASLQEDVRVANAATRRAKAEATRAVNRAEKGLCPHCRRHFANVERHCARQHPGQPKPERVLP